MNSMNAASKLILGWRSPLESQRALRNELRILIMSATLDCIGVAKLLGGAPVVSAEGRVFPVETHFLDQPLSIPLERYGRDDQKSVAAGAGEYPRSFCRGSRRSGAWSDYYWTPVSVPMSGSAAASWRSAVRGAVTGDLAPGSRYTQDRPLYGDCGDQLDHRGRARSHRCGIDARSAL